MLKAGVETLLTLGLAFCSVLRLHMMASMRSWSPKTELRDVAAWDRGVGITLGRGRNSKGSSSSLKTLRDGLATLVWTVVMGVSDDMEAVDDEEDERLYTGGNMAESTGEAGVLNRESNILWGLRDGWRYECYKSKT